MTLPSTKKLVLALPFHFCHFPLHAYLLPKKCLTLSSGAAIPEKQFFMDWTNKSPYPNPTELTLEITGMIRQGALNPTGTKLAIISYHEYLYFSSLRPLSFVYIFGL